MSSFAGLGRALRVLRERRDLRQYEVAGTAGITKAMLSAYEVGKQLPSITSLERILDALGSSLSELDRELRVAQEERKESKERAGESQKAALRGQPDVHSGDASRSSEVTRWTASIDRTLLGLIEERLDEVHAILRKELGAER